MHELDISHLFLTILGQYNLERQHLAVAEEKPLDGMLSEKMDIVYTHEKFHHIQTLMTNYGQIRWRMNREATKDILYSWIEYTNKYEKNRPMPIGHLVTKDSVEDIQNAVRCNINGIGLMLLGLQNYVPPSISKMSDTVYVEGEYDIIPKVSVYGKEYALNGIDIIESHAKYVEAVYAKIVYSIPFSVTYDRTKIPEKYYYAYAYFIEQIGEDRIEEFPIICNLALQTDYVTSIDESNWKNNHPAWRFITLIEKLKTNSLPPMNNENVIKANYMRYTNELLGLCGYKSMKEVLSLASLKTEYKDEKLLSLEKQMDLALLYRIEKPWCAANPFIDIESWNYLGKHFNSPLAQYGETLHYNLIEDGDVYQANSLKSNEYAEYTIEIHLQALASQILGGISPYSQNIDEIQCGFAYYGIARGCYYQRTGECNGSLEPALGYKVAWEFIDDENVQGCMFGMFMDACIGVGIQTIDLNFRNRRFPSRDVLIERLRKLKANC